MVVKQEIKNNNPLWIVSLYVHNLECNHEFNRERFILGVFDSLDKAISIVESEIFGREYIKSPTEFSWVSRKNGVISSRYSIDEIEINTYYDDGSL